MDLEMTTTEREHLGKLAGPLADWARMNTKLIDATDWTILYVWTHPTLLRSTPRAYLRAVRARMAALLRAIDYELDREPTERDDVDPGMAARIEQRTEALTAYGRGRLDQWQRGEDPDVPADVPQVEARNDDDLPTGQYL
jgi:hypothetical protein